MPIHTQYAHLLRAIAQERRNREQSLLVLLSLTTLLLANTYLQREHESESVLSEEQQKQLVRLHRDYCYVVRRQMKNSKGNKKGNRNAKRKRIRRD